MPKFGKSSLARLDTCAPDVQAVMLEAVKFYDLSIIQGFRAPEEQFREFKKGRALIGGKWVVVDKSKITTQIDGLEKVGRHNVTPAEAVDFAPYPVNYKKEDRFIFLAGFIVGLSQRMKAEGRIARALVWGGDWDSDLDLDDQTLHDLDHLQLEKKGA